MSSDTKNKTAFYKKEILKHAKIEIHGAIISSVVPALDPLFNNLCLNLFGFKPLFVNYKNCGIKVKYNKPSVVGADRLVNAVAGKVMFGAPLIIIDFGTATTFDCIDKSGAYAGGAILPGIDMSLKALNHFTAKLPLVKFSKPKNIIGKNTIESIKSGIYYGYTGSIIHFASNLKKTLKCDKIIATGGYANLIAKPLEISNVPDLTLHGLKIIWENNKLNRKSGEDK